jgi:hypothetical protein
MAALSRSGPGVYINEIAAFGPSIVSVATALPVFIGYTQFAGDPATGAPLYDRPVSIRSMTDYVTHFGGPAPLSYRLSIIPPPPSPQPTTPPPTPDFTAYYTPDGADAPVLQGFLLNPAPDQAGFSLYWQMRLFFANGGGLCYVVSAGSYWSGERPTSATDTSTFQPGAITAQDLTAGIAAAGLENGPTMTVVPEACQLDRGGYAAVAQAMIDQAGALQDRMAILDLPGCLAAGDLEALAAAQAALWTAIAPSVSSAGYAAAYAPALVASIVTVNDILYTDLAVAAGDGNALINDIATTQAYQFYSGSPGQLAAIQSAIAAAFPLSAANNGANTPSASGNGTAYPAQQPGETLLQWQMRLDTLLLNALPVLAQIEQRIAGKMNVMAPSGAMAGIWTKSDNLGQVWSAPANIEVASVDAPLCDMSDAQQGRFNMPTNGMAIDVIRRQVGRGAVVWGARTLDGNSLDYRYIQVRRTLTYVEQSIKLGLQAYAFAPNDAGTWATVTAALTSFLDSMWQAGGLVGSKPSDAYRVTCGVGSTMSHQDVLDGVMNVAVTVALVHPAEYIELSFTQLMQS